MRFQNTANNWSAAVPRLRSLVSVRYTDRSAFEVVTFLCCAHRTVGKRSLPWLLAQRCPDTIPIIAKFLLEPNFLLAHCALTRKHCLLRAMTPRRRIRLDTKSSLSSDNEPLERCSGTCRRLWNGVEEWWPNKKRKRWYCYLCYAQL